MTQLTVTLLGVDTVFLVSLQQPPGAEGEDGEEEEAGQADSQQQAGQGERARVSQHCRDVHHHMNISYLIGMI